MGLCVFGERRFLCKVCANAKMHGNRWKANSVSHTQGNDVWGCARVGMCVCMSARVCYFHFALSLVSVVFVCLFVRMDTWSSSDQ